MYNEKLDEGLKDKWIMTKAKVRNFISDIKTTDNDRFNKWLSENDLSKEMNKKLLRSLLFKNTGSLADELKQMAGGDIAGHINEDGFSKIVNYAKSYLTNIYQKYQDKFEKEKDRLVKEIWLEGRRGKIKEDAVIGKIKYTLNSALEKAAGKMKREGDDFKSFIVNDIILRESPEKFVKDIDRIKPKAPRKPQKGDKLLKEILGRDKTKFGQLP